MFSGRGEGFVVLLITPFLLFPDQVDFSFAVCGAVLLFVWMVRFRSEGIPIIPHSPQRILWLYFGITVVVGGLVSADFHLTQPKAAGLLLAFAWWRLINQITIDRQTFQTNALGIAAFALAITIAGVLTADWPTKVPILTPIIESLPTQRLALPNNAGISTNQLAGTILLFLPIVVSGLFDCRRHQPLRIVVLFVSSGLLTVLLVLTQSRSGWIGGVIGLLVVLVLKVASSEKTRDRILPLGLLVLAICIGGLLLAQVGPERLAEIWTEPPRETTIGSLATIAFRQEVWQWSLVAIHDFPVTGTGLGAFRDVVNRLYPIEIPLSYDIAHAHNIFLQTALDLGLFGLVVYIGLVISGGVQALKISRADGVYRSVGHGFFAGLIGFHAYGMTDALALGSKTSIIFWMTLGLVSGAYVSLYPKNQ